MKIETLVSRYKNLGYTPLGLEPDLEVDSIIKWIYYTHDVYIGVTYCGVKFPSIKGMPQYMSFRGYRVWNTKTKHNNTIYDDLSFMDAYAAKFHCVKTVYKAIKFQKY